MPAARRALTVRILLALASLIVVVLAGVFAAAALVRYSPGFDIDENAWNPKIAAATLQSMHVRNERENRLPIFFAHYLRAALHGDLGRSDSLGASVTELLRERAPVSASNDLACAAL